MQMNREALLDGAQQVFVPLDLQAGMQAALHQHAGAPEVEGFLDPGEDGFVVVDVAFGVAHGPVEGTETAIFRAEIGVINVAIDDVRDHALGMEPLAEGIGGHADTDRKLRPNLQLARVLPAAKGLELLATARLDAPYEPAVATETGKILLSEGQAEGALEEFGRALALAPMDARNMNNRGVALMVLGQTEAARADFERALRTLPSLVEARENLAKLPPRPQ